MTEKTVEELAVEDAIRAAVSAAVAEVLRKQPAIKSDPRLIKLTAEAVSAEVKAVAVAARQAELAATQEAREVLSAELLPLLTSTLTPFAGRLAAAKVLSVTYNFPGKEVGTDIPSVALKTVTVTAPVVGQRRQPETRLAPGEGKYNKAAWQAVASAEEITADTAEMLRRKTAGENPKYIAHQVEKARIDAAGKGLHGGHWYNGKLMDLHK